MLPTDRNRPVHGKQLPVMQCIQAEFSVYLSVITYHHFNGLGFGTHGRDHFTKKLTKDGNVDVVQLEGIKSTYKMYQTF